MAATSRSMAVRAVLIVDDDETFRSAMKQAVSKEGMYRIRLADSGEAALVALREDRFDVILLDYFMSGISGLNVLQWMHEQKIDTPVVMLTAAGSETVAVEAMKMGAYDYLPKDQIDLNRVRILINGVIERYLFRQDRERREAMEREREKSVMALETFQVTLTSLVQIVNNSLSIASLRIRENERNLKTLVPEGGQRLLSQAFGEVTQEHWVIASAVKSMLDISNVLRGNFAVIDDAERIRKLMITNDLMNLHPAGSRSTAMESDENREERNMTSSGDRSKK